MAKAAIAVKTTTRRVKKKNRKGRRLDLAPIELRLSVLADFATEFLEYAPENPRFAANVAQRLRKELANAIRSGEIVVINWLSSVPENLSKQQAAAATPASLIKAMSRAAAAIKSLPSAPS